jgi:ATP-binding cassette, subfamily B, bacterial
MQTIMAAVRGLLRQVTQTPPFALVIQNDETECGLASLSMILAANALGSDLELLRRDYGSTRGGMTVGELCRFSSDHGLRATPNYGEIDKSPTLPCIIFARGEHFSVLWKIRNGKYWVADPSDGALILDTESFNLYYSNLTITFRAIKRLLSSPGTTRETSSLASILPIRQILTASVIALAVVASILTLVNAAAQDVFMTYIVEEGEIAWTKGLVVFTIVLGLALAIAQILMQYLLMRQVQGSILKWNLEVFKSLFNAPYSFFINKSSGLISSRFNQVDESLLSFQSAVIASFTGLLNLSIFFIAVSLVSWPLAVIALLAILGFIGVGLKFYGLNIQNNYLAREGQAAAATAEYKLISGKDQIVQENSDASIIKEFTTGYLFETNAYLKIQQTEAVNEFFLSFVDQVLNATLLVVSAVLIVQGNLTTGTYAAINVIIGTALQPIRSLSSIIEAIQNSRMTLKAANELYTAPPIVSETIDEDEQQAQQGDLKAISFESVYYRHSAYAPNIIENFSISINSKSEASWCVHLDGDTGSGKTTFLNLLLGFAKPMSGKVTLYSHDISTISQQERNKLIQLVDRSPTITAGSVRQNAQLGIIQADMNYMDAIQCLGLQEQTIFTQQSQRYLQDDTSISTGQAVMIGLVRAAMKKPKILLIDEALASLPEELHAPILSGFKKLGINVLIVQHGDSAIIKKLPQINTRRFVAAQEAVR